MLNPLWNLTQDDLWQATLALIRISKKPNGAIYFWNSIWTKIVFNKIKYHLQYIKDGNCLNVNLVKSLEQKKTFEMQNQNLIDPIVANTHTGALLILVSGIIDWSWNELHSNDINVKTFCPTMNYTTIKLNWQPWCFLVNC